MVYPHFKSTSFKEDLKEKKATILKFNAYRCTQGILLFIFSHWRFNFWLIDGRPLIKIKLIRLVNRVYFQVRSMTKKWNMESAVWKYSVESTVHGTWKQYGNTVYVCWRQNKMTYGKVLLVHIHTLLHF